MLHTRLSFTNEAFRAIHEELYPLWDYFYPLSQPHLRVRIGPDREVRVEQELSEPDHTHEVLWAALEGEMAVVLKTLEADLSSEEAAKKERARRRGYYDLELLACRRPLVAIRIGDLRHISPRSHRTGDKPRLNYSPAQGYHLLHRDGAKTIWGHSEKLAQPKST